MAKVTYPIGTICKMLDLTDRRVQQLSKEGILPKTEKGKYDLVGCVRGYVHYLRDRSLGKDSDLDGFQWRDRKLKAEALKAEMELDEMRKVLVPVEKVENYLDKLFTAIKQHILGMPTKVAPMVLNEEGVEGIELVLSGEAHGILNLIADYEIDDESDDGESSNKKLDSEVSGEGKTPEEANGNGVGK